MPFDMDKFKSGIGKFIDRTSKKIRQYTPESFSKEKQFVNAIVASLALMVIADRKVETEEVTSSIDMISEIDEIRELDMNKEAIELFEHHIDNLIPVMDDEIKWTIKVGKLIQDIGRIREHKEYIPMIENLLDYIANVDGHLDPLEIQMKEKILKSLSA